MTIDNAMDPDTVLSKQYTETDLNLLLHKIKNKPIKDQILLIKKLIHKNNNLTLTKTFHTYVKHHTWDLL